MWEAKQLKEKRAKDKISANTLAEMLGRGASKENVYKWENGVVRPKSKGMSRKIQSYLKGTLPIVAATPIGRKKKKPAKTKQPVPQPIKTNGAVHKDEYKEKFKIVNDKYNALLEEHVNLLRKLVNPIAP